MLFHPEALWRRLQSSPFRARFRLNLKDQLYFDTKGLPLILSHARDFIEQRLAAPFPKNDGKQTPMRGHPVFVAQHATATCCRGCLAKWHNIPQGQALDEQQKRYIVQVIALWLERRAGVKADDSANPFDPDRGL
ncbi:Uncharacterised protein [Serratia proteamaculans]|uniref:DUF4186 domain-containing protein n=1 Tax=Serratia proteamaculans TaxID=28151 RepID=A0ABS0TR23_SERPR|nr:DUF4186 domain-containing protein [Serratia proteamaculans]KAB1499328.1 DUF4186 domain-containing protein [Serratia proteamaculans]MBI6179938.1 DUF4186 domain-containing protein [Serratia proteamaculans]RYM48045.1 DUF4186 domain-containing protein [Serratia proteamaculans]RYM50434.1 DUF4186 domain-containing protein [Serratia proteamaculans]CAI0698635.1 Uncharacterised protein [Serratia proteamaculans]